MAQWTDVLIEDLKRHEGLRLKAYLCTAGVPTIGYGATRYLDGTKVQLGDSITQSLADLMLKHDVKTAVADARATLPVFDELDGPRKTVWANMAYNLGRARLAGFKNTIAAIVAKDYAQAALRMKQSKWATQVGQRATFLINRMATGKW